MKLELKHIAPYLPYKPIVYGGGTFSDLFGIHHQEDEENGGEIFVNIYDGVKYHHEMSMDEHSLVLRPLSDLTEEIEYDGDTDTAISFIATSNKDKEETLRLIEQLLYVRLPYWKMERLFEMHFDIFGLIDKELAIEKSNPQV